MAHEMTWKVSRQTIASGARSATTSRIQVGAVSGHELQPGGAFVAEGVEELADGGLAAALGGPHHLAGDVVADDGQVALPLLVLDLVDGDSDEPVEQIDPPERFGRHPHAHVVHRPPRHPVAVRGGLLVADDGVVHDEILEGPGERRVVPRPRHLRHRRTAHRAVDSAGIGDQLAGGEPDIDVPPAALTTALVVERGQFAAATAAAPPASLQA